MSKEKHAAVAHLVVFTTPADPSVVPKNRKQWYEAERDKVRQDLERVAGGWHECSRARAVCEQCLAFAARRHVHDLRRRPAQLLGRQPVCPQVRP